MYQTSEVEAYICSGVVWDSEGHIVTNYYAIRKACNFYSRYQAYSEVFILTYKGVEEKYMGELVGESLFEDLAVLKVIYLDFSPSLRPRRETNIIQNTKASVATINTNPLISMNLTSEVETYICSGAVWDSEGHIVTNYYAIRKACNFYSRYQAYFEVFILNSKGVEEKYMGELVGESLFEDLAVLKISAPKLILKPIMVGESTGISVGQTCFTIGAPSACVRTFTAGLISGLNREYGNSEDPPLRGLIQTDAFTDKGTCGGPLLDYKGYIIGLITRGFSASIGYAIPFTTVAKIVPQLIKI